MVMIPLTAAQIAAAVAGELTSGTDPDTLVDATRVVAAPLRRRGSRFGAPRGQDHEGHQFLASACAAGASLALVTQPTTHPAVLVSDAQYALGQLARYVLAQLPLARVIALTGSAGKTTTKDLISQIISPLAPTIAPLGSFNKEIDRKS